jgi:hypothetical protein
MGIPPSTRPRTVPKNGISSCEPIPKRDHLIKADRLEHPGTAQCHADPFCGPDFLSGQAKPHGHPPRQPEASTGGEAQRPSSPHAIKVPRGAGITGDPGLDPGASASVPCGSPEAERTSPPPNRSMRKLNAKSPGSSLGESAKGGVSKYEVRPAMLVPSRPMKGADAPRPTTFPAPTGSGRLCAVTPAIP